MEDPNIYVCEGTCEGQATPIQFEKNSKCQDSKCTKYNQKLSHFKICSKCWKRYKDKKEHDCSK